MHKLIIHHHSTSIPQCFSRFFSWNSWIPHLLNSELCGMHASALPHWRIRLSCIVSPRAPIFHQTFHKRLNIPLSEWFITWSKKNQSSRSPLFLVKHHFTYSWEKKRKHFYLFQYKLLYRNKTGTNHLRLSSTSIWCFKIFLRDAST